MPKITVEIDVPDPVLEPVFRALATQPGQLSEAQAAGLVHLSRGRFSRVFRRSCGVTFRNARVEAKLQMAEALLAHTALRISEIAYAVGYARLSRFERAFKKKHGLTPTVFRHSRAG